MLGYLHEDLYEAIDINVVLCALSMLQTSLKTEKQKKKEMYFPLRKYAIKV